MINSGERHVAKNPYEYAGHDYVWALSYIKEFPRKNAVIADVGCGSGKGSALISNENKIRAIGTDYCYDILKHAKNLFKDQQFCPHFVTTDCHRLAFKEKSIDIIISIGTLEHLHNAHQFLAETKRILKEDGLLLITIPNRDFVSPGLNRPVNLFHVKEYTFKEIQDLMSQFYQKFEIYGSEIKGNYRDMVKTYRKNFRYRIGVRLGQLEVFRRIFRLVPGRLQLILMGVPKLKTSYADCVLTRDNLDNAMQFNIVVRNTKNN